MNKLPTVSLIIPCKNENEFIAQCLDSLIANNYPKDKLEILVIDGMSYDGSRDIIKKYIQKFPYIKMLDNHKKITPTALNIGVKNSNGQILMIISAHSICEPEYISKSVKYLYKYNVDNIGGIMIPIPKKNGLLSSSIIYTMSNPFGIGFSSFRTSVKYPKYVDTVFGGCYRREVFEKIGFFNELLKTGQDKQFNYRLIKSGGKILLHPDIKIYYYARSDFKSFCLNNIRRGFWIIYGAWISKTNYNSLRHYIPLIFVSGFLFLTILYIFNHIFSFFTLALMALYLLLSIAFSIPEVIKNRKLRFLFLIPFMFISAHTLYGFASIWGLIRIIASPFIKIKK